jgi:aspartate/methionine/tyrosine aminotransferase
MGPGDSVLVPAPAFPVHIYAAVIAGANVMKIPIAPEKSFLEGEGFLRLALVENEERLRQAVRQMKKAMQNMNV